PYTPLTPQPGQDFTKSIPEVDAQAPELYPAGSHSASIVLPSNSTFCPRLILRPLRNSTSPSTRTFPSLMAILAIPPLEHTPVAFRSFASSMYSFSRKNFMTIEAFLIPNSCIQDDS